MFKVIFFVLILAITMYCITNKVYVKFATFLKKGYKKQNYPYGIYCYWNKQGSSKTQNCVKFLLDNKDKRIYANVKSIKGLHYKYFSGFNTLLELGTTESNCIIFYDELFKGIYKGKPMKPKEKEKLMDFMSQMRKRNIICLTTAQEWLEVPIEFRRYVRYDIKCKLLSFFGYPIIIKEFGDTENIYYDNLQNEYISPRIRTYIEHGMKKIVNSYDTLEVISTEEIAPYEIYTPLKSSEYLTKSEDFVKNSEVVSTELLTTTSNSVVNGQFTQTNLQLDTNVNSQQNVVDTDFWEDLTPNDFTQESQENIDHLHFFESGQNGQNGQSGQNG